MWLFAHTCAWAPTPETPMASTDTATQLHGRRGRRVLAGQSAVAFPTPGSVCL